MKKIGLMMILLLGIIMFSACGDRRNELEYVKNIKIEDIFNQKEDDYFIYFHQVDCQDCENSDPVVINYARLVNERAGCANKRKIYAVLLHSDSKIFRVYSGSDGQGTDGKYFVDGVKNWEDLYIASTASMIAISTNSKDEKTATYVAQGSTKVNDQLNTQLGECYSK